MADRRVDYLLIGGGVAAASCAQTLRRRGAGGSILLVGREPDPPYDRPPCSKGYLLGRQSRAETWLHPPEWYAEREIELLTRVSALKLDPATRSVRLSSREEVEYGHALLATGAGVRRLNVPGSELEGIHYLRTLGNSDALRADVGSGATVVVIGGSYLGTELAAALTDLGCRCSVVMLEPVMLSRGFGERVGRHFQSVVQDRGVVVHGGHGLERFEGANGRVRRVIASDGLELEADAVVVAAGAIPDVMLARSAGLELGQSGGVRTDARLRTSAPGVFAAGDVAEYESDLHAGRRLRIEHWDVALSQGRTVASNMLGADQPHQAVPYFFSDISDWTSFEYVGVASGGEQEIVRGSLEEGSFTVFYVADGRLGAALACGRSEDLIDARRLISQGVALDASAVSRLGDPDSPLAEI